MVAVEATSISIEKRGVSRESRLRRALFRILSSLDEKRPTGLVLVRTADGEVGRLAVSQGRLCLAFVTADVPVAGAATVQDSGESSARDLYEMAAETQARGGHLGATVQSGGRETLVRDVLLAETARGLMGILETCGSCEPALVVTPARDDYDEGLTLGTVETFAAALRTQFRIPWPVACETMKAVAPAGAALLLVRSAEPGEQPFPVAQARFDEGGVRKFAEMVRFVSDLSRPGTDSRLSAGTSITTFAHAGDTWRCIAGETRVVLLRAPPDAIEKATAWAHLFANAGGDGP